MYPPSNKKEAFREMLNILDNTLSRNGCNDFIVINNPEMFSLLEQAQADNQNMSLEDFRNSAEYEDYKPNVSKDGKYIYTQDFVIASVFRKELGL